ncbi:putative phage abortive infection protein [Rhizobium leguminosarum]|uniref:putative phage abortive infection protein n=1 Tax=Rhizobium leguminosarum TaxID=384 RepID=UPI001C949F11|nr:putative phage abortive infection protein [Rhizobium leguminosarum]MBY5788657.1 hypothetical protein [Rhizobium leguminosarum]
MTNKASAITVNSKQQHQDNLPVREPRLLWALAAVIAVMVLWLVNWGYGVSLDTQERGIFGDTFGAVNALFSGLAFAGVVYAILMQRYEVAIAKEDARETKKILDQQSRHLEMQTKLDRLKSFEDTFFKMLSVFMEVSATITFLKRSSEHGDAVYKGQHAISEIADNIISRSFFDEHTIQGYEDDLKHFMERYSRGLSHYFRSIESLLVYITAARDIDPEFYGELIRGQMSDAEQKILFHFCLVPGNERLKGLVERYHLLKGIKEIDVVFPELRDRFRTSAFELTSSHMDDAPNTEWWPGPRQSE